jgi:CTP synthase (UTP-ammonia lyase)
MSARIALLGDFSRDVLAHQAIPRALELACAATRVDASWEWIATRDLTNPAKDLSPFSGLWLVPASPYQNTEGALGAIRFARESKRRFLGTCGGFQHALIEFARNVAGLEAADHAETNPGGAALVIAPLSCSMVEKTGMVRFTPGSRIAAAYGAATAVEGYHCNYGVNPVYRTALEAAGMRFTAFDESGDIRAAELSPTTHPFFVGTLFQPERSALRGEIPPLVRAFVKSLSG